MAALYTSFINKTAVTTALTSYFVCVIRSASLYTEIFIMFSGLLTYHSIMGRIEKKKNVNILEEYIGRLFRLIPTLGALILFCTWILPVLGSGPMWPMVIDKHGTICKETWWRNFLFIHNYFGFENVCLTHTHHIGIDTQFFAIGVPLVIWIGTKPKYAKKTLQLIFILGIISTIARFYTSYTLKLANYLYFGVSVKEMFDTASYLYILPPYRFTAYAMGMLLGEALRRAPIFKLESRKIITGWIIAASFLYFSIFVTAKMVLVTYKYDPMDNALFTAFSPVFWCSIFMWVVYITHHGYDSFLGRFFSWRGFVIWTRLSYAVYLTQFPVFFYNIGITQVTQEFNGIFTLINMPELFWILFFSIVLTLIFDLPFQNLKNILMKKNKNTTEKQIAVD